jgi:hypothetical protein
MDEYLVRGLGVSVRTHRWYSGEFICFAPQGIVMLGASRPVIGEHTKCLPLLNEPFYIAADTSKTAYSQTAC